MPDGPKTTLHSISGAKSGEVSLPPEAFARRVNKKLLGQTVVSLMKNQRASKAHTKDRSEVSGGGRKPWRQKGTGRARHGSIRSPIWRGGGVTHGPSKNRKYRAKINARAKKQSLAMALSGKLKDKEVVVVDSLKISGSKTKTLKLALDELLKKRGQAKVLLVVASRGEGVWRAAGNIPSVSVVEARSVSALDVLSARYLVLEEGAVEIISKRVT